MFLSYARSNLSWIANFKACFAPLLGGAMLHNYLDQSGFGNIQDNLRDRIAGSYAFLASFSKQYCEQRYTLVWGVPVSSMCSHDLLPLLPVSGKRTSEGSRLGREASVIAQANEPGVNRWEGRR